MGGGGRREGEKNGGGGGGGDIEERKVGGWKEERGRGKKTGKGREGEREEIRERDSNLQPLSSDSIISTARPRRPLLRECRMVEFQGGNKCTGTPHGHRASDGIVSSNRGSGQV